MAGAHISSNSKWSIFTPLHEAVRDKELRKLRCGHCPLCHKVTFYRLISLNDKELRCKNCGAPITVQKPLATLKNSTTTPLNKKLDVNSGKTKESYPKKRGSRWSWRLLDIHSEEGGYEAPFGTQYGQEGSVHSG